MSNPASWANPAAGASAWKKTPAVIQTIQLLFEHDTAGDPITGIKWTHKTPEKIAGLLQQLGLAVSGFTPRGNRKNIATNSGPDRDRRILSLRLHGREAIRLADHEIIKRTGAAGGPTTV